MLSREEEAELARTNKKVKDIHHAEFNDDSREGSPSLGYSNAESTPRDSFKDKLMGEIPRAFVRAFEFENLMNEDEESNCENEEDNLRSREGRVFVRLSKETKQHIRGSWLKAIIF